MTALFGIHPEMLVLPLMYVGIGFFCASLLAVALSPAIHRRAERLTRRHLGKNIPPSLQELRVEKDHLRAQHAIDIRELTRGMEKLHEKAALQSAELGRKTAEANHLKIELQKKHAVLTGIEHHPTGQADDSRNSDLAAARFEADAARAALREAEHAIATLQADIAELTAAVENRSRLIDRQQHDIMALTAQVERNGHTPPIVPAPIAAPAARTPQSEQPAMHAKTATPPVHEMAPAPVRTPGLVSFESRLAAIRDDKPLRDVRPQIVMQRTAAIEPARSNVTTIETPLPPAAQVPAAPSPEAEPARLATDIRYDEPLTTADLLELGKAMLRQPATDGPPHRTH